MRWARRTRTRDESLKILVVCEGAETEPNYFKAFPVSSLTVKGEGKNTVSLVKECIRLKKKGRYDHVWAVFDRDEFSREDFNEAIRLANDNGISVAYSNTCFELWYALHFDFITTGLHRDDFPSRLTRKLGRHYLKNDRAIYSSLEHLQSTAIKNSKNLLATYSPPDPASDDPSTTVHLLVELLNSVRRP